MRVQSSKRTHELTTMGQMALADILFTGKYRTKQIARVPQPGVVLLQCRDGTAL
jgi:hypothetical protein